MLAARNSGKQETPPGPLELRIQQGDNWHWVSLVGGARGSQVLCLRTDWLLGKSTRETLVAGGFLKEVTFKGKPKG